MHLLSNTCKHCGQQWVNSHYCQAQNAATHLGAMPSMQLTEADVRRIVREELARIDQAAAPTRERAR